MLGLGIGLDDVVRPHDRGLIGISPGNAVHGMFIRVMVIFGHDGCNVRGEPNRVTLKVDEASCPDSLLCLYGLLAVHI